MCEKSIQRPPSPCTLEDLEIPVEYTVYQPSPSVNEDFLLGDSGRSSHRILICGRRANVANLKNSATWYVDGTFSITPPLFHQVYVILAEAHDAVHPFMYVLLPDKTEITYQRMFQMIKELDPAIAPSTIHCDFELAAINAFRAVFPQANIAACFFHLMQNMKKKVSSLGLNNMYDNDAEFACSARMIPCIAFVPPEKIENALETLYECTPEPLEPVLNWFEDYYVGRLRRNGRRLAPRYPIEIWNLYNRTLTGSSRTNNHAEAAHRRLQMEMGKLHPSIWDFIDSLRTCQKGRDAFYQSLVSGKSAPGKAKKYRDFDEMILNLMQRFDPKKTLDYLREIAYCFRITQ